MLDQRIETFLTVCKTMNFTKASELLHITQPAVSQHIHYLENRYGKKLFGYSGKKMWLTEAGEMLRRTAATMQNDEILLEEKLSSLGSGSTPLHFGVTMTIGEYVIAKPLARYLDIHPETDIMMEIENTGKLVELLKSGIIHFAIVEGYFDRSEFDSEVYDTVRFIPVCNASHIFARRVSRLTDLFGETIIIREEGSGTRDILEKHMAALNLSTGDFKKKVQIAGMHAILQLLSEDAGISFLYEPAAAGLIQAGILREIPLSDFKVFHDFALIWERGSVNADEFRSIGRELRDAAVE